MLKDRHIFILGLPRFDGPYESTNFTIARLLAKDNFVYYIDNPYTWKDYFKLKGSAEFEKRKPFFTGSGADVLDTDNPNLKIVITPPVPSINFLPEGVVYRLLIKYNVSIVRRKIKKILSTNGISDFIYINSFNFHYPDVCKGLKPKLTAYYCVDPIIVPFDKKHGIVSQDKIVKNSDLVICTSKKLLEENILKNQATYFVPNAADVTHSSKALDANLPVSEILSGIPRPVVGYFGNIERRIDYEVLKAVISKNQDKSFVFVGPHEKNYIPDWLENTLNVYLPGRIPYSEMPSVLKGFDIAILPFKKDEVSQTIFPLKLFEYLGAGKPTVALNFNEDLKAFTDDAVRYCSTVDEFSDAINNELKNNTQEKINKRVEIASQNTWDNRIESIKNILENHLTNP